MAAEDPRLISRARLDDDVRFDVSLRPLRLVDYIGQLQQLDTTGVEPLAHALDLHDVFRDDEPCVSLTVEEALANAPAKNAAYYRVPAVMD